MTDIKDLTAERVAADVAERFDTAPVGDYTLGEDFAFSEASAAGAEVVLEFSNATNTTVRRYRVTVTEL